MNRNRPWRLAVFGLAVVWAVPASAFLWTFDDPLEGTQEVPPNASPATGRTYGTYDDVSNMLDIYVQATGFPTNVVAAHIHGPAPRGMNAGVIFPLSGQTGLMTYNSRDMFTLTEQQESDLLGELNYVNIHTQQFPGGEVRGQLNPVPEPATAAVIAGGLGLLAFRRRKR